MTTRTATALAALLAGLAVGSGAALADALDGDWCAPDGRHLTIDGPRVITPAGKRLEGNYTRHRFDYRIPDAEPQAGLTLFMVQMNDTAAQVRIAADRAAAEQMPAQIWRRCARPTS
jgi:hypothetical protein